MNILVTGYKGFIGSNLYDELKTKYNNVFGMDIEFYSGNWTINLTQILDDIDPNVVFHVGACTDTLNKDVNKMMEMNFESTKIISDWCFFRKSKLIYSSSASVYGINNSYPSNLYGWSKRVSEEYVKSKKQVALRYFNVYGPGEEHKGKMSSVAYQMYNKNKNNEPVILFNGFPKRDFVYIRDVVNANIHAFKNYNKLKSMYFDVGSGAPHTFEDVMDYMGINYTYSDVDITPIGYQFYSCSDVNKWLPSWKPIYDLEKGIKEYKKYLYENNSNR